MIPSALSKGVVLGLAMAAIGAIHVATAGLSADASQRFVTPQDQAVNGTAKTDRLVPPDVESTVVRTEKANRRHRSQKSELEFKFEPTSTHETGPTASVPPKRKATPRAVDDVTSPVVRANDDPGAVVEPAANADETSRNFAEESSEREPLSWSAWSYSKGLVDRTDRRARFLWNRLVDR